MAGIFICYRRDDTGGYAGRLYDRLARQFGSEQIFMDIDAIPVGEDFVQFIDQRIRACNVMVVLIGKDWSTLEDHFGRRRIHDPADFVRLEIEAALTRNITLIPVLVAGARMPAPQDLPGQIVRLASLNAFEIFDRMFEESVARLISTLRPHVRTPLSRHWRSIKPALLDAWRRLRSMSFSQQRKGILVRVAMALLLLSVAFRLSNWPPGTPSVRTPVESHESPAPEAPPVTRGLDAGATRAPAIELKTPVRISGLPPVVESARHVSNIERDEKHSPREGFDRAVGPRHPSILWKADFPSLGQFLGLAGDGTLYFEGNSAIYAIRDGRQQWGYKVDGIARFAADGRIWLDLDGQSADQLERRFLVYNSRGEGGLTTIKELPDLAASSTPSIIGSSGWGSSGVRGWTEHYRLVRYTDCGLRDPTSPYGELTGVYEDKDNNEKAWKLKIEGRCGAFAVDDDGSLITVTDTGTLYSVSPQGHVRWTRKVVCQPDHLIAWGGSDTVYSCANVLHALRGGEPRWDFKLEQEPVYSWAKVDKANTLYLPAEKPVSLMAIDDAGKLLWRLPFEKATLLGLDTSGRLYIRSESTLVCLSD